MFARRTILSFAIAILLLGLICAVGLWGCEKDKDNGKDDDSGSADDDSDDDADDDLDDDAAPPLPLDHSPYSDCYSCHVTEYKAPTECLECHKPQ